MDAIVDGLDGKPRKVNIVIEDDGTTNFKLYMTGDVARLGKTSPSQLSAAEFWGARFFALCIQELKTYGDVRQMKGPAPLTPPTEEVKK